MMFPGMGQPSANLWERCRTAMRGFGYFDGMGDGPGWEGTGVELESAIRIGRRAGFCGV